MASICLQFTLSLHPIQESVEDKKKESEWQGCGHFDASLHTYVLCSKEEKAQMIEILKCMKEKEEEEEEEDGDDEEFPTLKKR